jgi:hypothetical protein
MWREAMSDLNEQIHVEDDTLDLEPGEKRPNVRAPGMCGAVAWLEVSVNRTAVCWRTAVRVCCVRADMRSRACVLWCA